jgi:2-iminobutanoate/2-iminopropanoate deaminase
MRSTLPLLLMVGCLTGAELRQVFPAGVKVVGPYSPGIVAGHFLYVSGQGARKNDQSMAPEVDAQTRQCIENVKGILENAGFVLNDVVYAQVYVNDIEKFDLVDAVYKGTFTHSPPRTFIAVTRMPTDTPVEMSVVASKTPGTRFYLPGVLGKDAASNRLPADMKKQAAIAFDAADIYLKRNGHKLADLQFVTIYFTDKMPRAVVEKMASGRLHAGVKRVFVQTSALPAGANIELTGIGGADDLIFTTARSGDTAEVLNGLRADIGGPFDRVVVANVYIDDIEHFATMNKTYASFFGTIPPTRTTVQPAAPSSAGNTINLISVK